MNVRQLIALCCLALVVPPGSARSREPLADLPRVIVWAWERPEDLRWTGQDVGIAFLSQTVTVNDGRLIVSKRRQPLRVSDSTPLISVTRIEAPSAMSPEPDRATVEDVATLIAASSRQPRVRAVQVDFDATASQRAWYRALLHEVRLRLQDSTPLSITALASWCAGDRWLGNLPVDEVVPMLFDMGPADDPYASIAVSPDAAAPECRAAVGLAVDEDVPVKPRGRRVYLFSRVRWTPALFDDALARTNP